MYKPTEPIRCPKCGAIVKVDLYKILTSNPPCYEWTCPNCGEKGNTKQGNVITFENQIGGGTSGYIQKLDEPDLGVGVTTTNATEEYDTINVVPSIYSPVTECEICGVEFKYDAKHMHICPRCREAVVKLRETTDGTANTMPVAKSTATDTKSAACDIPTKPFLQQGWECPKCGAILAPNQHYCPFCSPSEYGRTNWLGTTYGEWTNKDNLTPPSGQYINPNPNTNISDLSFTYTTPNIAGEWRQAKII